MGVAWDMAMMFFYFFETKKTFLTKILPGIQILPRGQNLAYLKTFKDRFGLKSKSRPLRTCKS